MQDKEGEEKHQGVLIHAVHADGRSEWFEPKGRRLREVATGQLKPLSGVVLNAPERMHSRQEPVKKAREAGASPAESEPAAGADAPPGENLLSPEAAEGE